MGKILGLELHNFKSYKGTAKVGFGNAAFTSIIGPNGAGKSNMMDAISFVLGVQSFHLRSNNLKDLIHRGPIDESESYQTFDSAYVIAVYEKANGEQMVLQRSINATGTSEYKINDKSVTALQYTMMLKGENILVKARNFLVFQGDIESVASQEPKQLAHLFEIISGSAEYADEYERLQEEMEKAIEVHTEVFSRKRNLTTESKQYKEQMREREIFEEKLSEKSRYTKIAHLYKLYHNEKKHFKLKSDITIATESLTETNRKLAECEESFQSIASETAAHELDMKKCEKNIASLKEKAQGAKRALLPIQSSKKSLENKISFTQKKIKDLEADIEVQTNVRQSLQSKIDETDSQYLDFKKRIAELESRVSIPPEGVAAYEELRQAYLARSGFQLERDMSLIIADKTTCEANIEELESQVSQSHTKIADLESNIKVSLGSTLHDLNAELKDLEQMKLSKLKEKEVLQKHQEAATFKMLELNSELRDVQSRLEELASSQKESKKQRLLRDNVAMLRSLMPEGSIKGFVYDLVHASQRKYSLALSTVLGADFDSVVVDTFATAYKCIEILKERRAGLASFIPLNSVVSEPMNLNYLRSLHEGARPAIDVVKFDDPAIERAVQYVVGNTIIVDDFETARALKWSSDNALHCKLVSLDGSVIHKSGLMTGGQQDKRMGASAGWSKSEMDKLLKKKDEISMELEKVASEKPSGIESNTLSEEIASIDSQIPSIESRIHNVERQIFEKNQEIKFFEQSIDESAEKLNRKRADLDSLEIQVQDLQNKIADLQSAIYSDFCEKYGLKSIDDYEMLHGAASRARARDRSAFEKSLASLKGQLEFQDERLRETEQRKVRLESEIVRFNDDLKSLAQNIKNSEDVLKSLESENLTANTAKADSAEAFHKKTREATAKESEKKEIEYELKSLIRERTQMEEALLKVDAERLNLLKNCKIEDVDLPLEDGFLDNVSLDVNDISQVAYQVHIDYGLLEARYQDNFSARTEAEIRVRIENIENELHALTPNTKALERLREVDQKLKEFDREFTKAKQEVTRITKKFNEVRDVRRDLFMKAFNHISENIDRVYKSLTKCNASPLGGSADLTLEDEEQPFSAGVKYHAMPPMKRFRDMDLLSGGEKSMAALALLFAIHSFQPSPFFVLDEIDAALDNSNVKKIARYIKENAGPDFQFIVISLKSTMFENSDALVGIYRDQRENCSKTVSLDLRKYPEEHQTIAIPGAHQIAAAEN